MAAPMLMLTWMDISRRPPFSLLADDTHRAHRLSDNFTSQLMRPEAAHSVAGKVGTDKHYGAIRPVRENVRLADDSSAPVPVDGAGGFPIVD